MSDFHQALGAGPPAGTLQVTVFIPSVDRDHHPIAQEAWAEECLTVLGTLFAVPPRFRLGEASGGTTLKEGVSSSTTRFS